MSTENEAAIKVIVELQAKPGKRVELKNLIDSVAAKYRLGQPGFLDSTTYEVVDNPNILVEIADWASAEVRAAAGYGRRCLCTSGGTFSCAVQGDGHQAAALIRLHIQ